MLAELTFHDMAQSTKEVITASALAIPTLTKMVWASRTDLQDMFDLKTVSGCLGFMRWWSEDGQQHYPEIECYPPPVRDLLSDFSEFEDLPAFLAQIVRDRSDLSKAFDLQSKEGRIAAKIWWEKFGGQEYPFLSFLTPNHNIPDQVRESSNKGAHE
jgi:hypothetical protein